MQNAETLTQEQIQDFLKGSQPIEFTGQNRRDLYDFVQHVLGGPGVRGTRQKGARSHSGIPEQSYRIERTADDTIDPPIPAGGRSGSGGVWSPAFSDEIHQAGCGAIGGGGPSPRLAQRVLKREHEQFGKNNYAHLAEISVAHLYNLRGSAAYRKVAANWQPTRPSAIGIGERRKPDPRGRPGFLRIDTVHQGDWEGAKGVYHINAVDTVTQWQVVGCVERISEHFLLPVLEAVLHQFPFRILGFHSDNGSEYVNYEVEELLKNLFIEFTKSRANRTQDNALVEGKNGAVIRKHIGYGHIAAKHAEAVHKFYTTHLNPYLNFHRPCGFATVSLDARGKRRRQYPQENYATPYEKLKGLEKVETYLKPNVSLVQLEQMARKMSDTECARKMTTAKTQLLRQCKMESPMPTRT